MGVMGYGAVLCGWGSLGPIDALCFAMLQEVKEGDTAQTHKQTLYVNAAVMIRTW